MENSITIDGITYQEITEAQKNRVQQEWSCYAKEQIRVETQEYIFQPIFAFGSEIACLRLFYVLKSGRVNYSTNLNTWVYSNK